MARASWSWVVADGAGTPLAELTTATGRQIAYKRNAATEATCTIAHEDEAAALLLDALRSGVPQLYCWRTAAGSLTSELKFRGHLAPFAEAVEEDSTLSLVFRSPFARLQGDGSGRGRFTEATTSYAGTDAGTIAANLLALANAQGATGLVLGAVEATKLRDRAYPAANIGEAIVNLTRVLDGFDFEEVFTEGGSLATLNIYAALGEDRPNAKFEYGEATLNNVRRVERTTQPPINAATVLGANGLTGTAESAVSIATYGYWPVQQSASDVTEQATLDDKAESLLRPYPVRTVTFVPEYALPNCPQPFDDFDLGDTVRLYARRSALVEDVTVQVNGMTILVDDNGFEVAQIADPEAPEEDDTQFVATLDVEVVDPPLEVAPEEG